MVDADLLVALGFSAACTIVLFAAGVCLLWLRPRTAAKRLLGAGFVVMGLAGAWNVGFLLDFPGGPDPWFYMQNVNLGVATLLLLGFLAAFPEPPRWRSTEGALTLAILGYAVVALAVEVVSLGTATGHFVGVFSTAFTVLRVGAMVLALERIRRASAGAAKTATNLVVATAPLLFISAGYTLVNDPLRFLGVLIRHRYGSVGPPDVDVSYALDILGSVGLAAFVTWRYRTRLPLALAGIGVLAITLDQFSRYDIIDFGIQYLVPAVVAIHGVSRDGLFGVAKVPARAGIYIGALTGVSIFIAVAAVFTLVAPKSPFFIMLGSLAGLVAGAVIAYQLRPRGVGLAIYRNAQDAPARAMTATPVAPGARVAGRYLVDRVLGEGGQARAFLARDEVLHRDVVLKTLPAGEPAALREARVLAMLEHPNVIRIHDVLETQHETLVVLEYAPNGNLRAHARRHPPDAAEAARILDEVLAGLEAAHALGVVHGDVKAENVLVAERGVMKLADFGVSSAPRPDATVATGAGTLQSMSPEQIRGGPADARSDVYAAGLLLAELSGCAPWPTARLDDFQLRAILLTREPDLAKLDPALRSVVARALAKEPAARYASAAEMRAELRRALGAWVRA